tara:strand:- start:31 stop:153 length:123 start_codon:yes stop_codon:yes gene_type:complete
VVVQEVILVVVEIQEQLIPVVAVVELEVIFLLVLLMVVQV